MLRISRAGLSILALLAASWVVAQEARLGDHPASLSGYAAVYQENCAVCHGDRLQGAAQGTRLIGIDLKHGDSFAEISASIANGFADKGMPAWSQTMTDLQIKNIALFVSETRSGLDYADFKYDAPFSLPTQTIATELHSFTSETVIDGLDPLPFSIAPLPDGRILLTEKKRGLSIVAPEGEQSPYIAGTPPHLFRHIHSRGQTRMGQRVDARCYPPPTIRRERLDLFALRRSLQRLQRIQPPAEPPVSMNTIVRGRINDATWVDEELIWGADKQFYGPGPELGTGGRIAFDNDGHMSSASVCASTITPAGRLYAWCLSPHRASRT